MVRCSQFQNYSGSWNNEYFFKINGKIITPNLDGSILAGITRMSVIELLRYKGYEVTERPISIDEINEASKE